MSRTWHEIIWNSFVNFLHAPKNRISSDFLSPRNWKCLSTGHHPHPRSNFRWNLKLNSDHAYKFPSEVLPHTRVNWLGCILKKKNATTRMNRTHPGDYFFTRKQNQSNEWPLAHWRRSLTKSIFQANRLPPPRAEALYYVTTRFDLTKTLQSQRRCSAHVAAGDTVLASGTKCIIDYWMTRVLKHRAFSCVWLNRYMKISTRILKGSARLINIGKSNHAWFSDNAHWHRTTRVWIWKK